MLDDAKLIIAAYIARTVEKQNLECGAVLLGSEVAHFLGNSLDEVDSYPLFI